MLVLPNKVVFLFLFVCFVHIDNEPYKELSNEKTLSILTSGFLGTEKCEWQLKDGWTTTTRPAVLNSATGDLDVFCKPNVTRHYAPFPSTPPQPSPPPPPPQSPLRSLLHIPFVIFQGRHYPPPPPPPARPHPHPLHSSIPTCQHGPPVILKLQALRELLSVFYTDDLAICFSSRFDVCVTSCSFQEIRFPHLVVSTSRWRCERPFRYV